MSAEILLKENVPYEWKHFLGKYNAEGNGSYTVSTEVLNHLLKLEIIMDELMRAGIHNFEGWDDAMIAAQRRFKEDEE